MRGVVFRSGGRGWKAAGLAVWLAVALAGAPRAAWGQTPAELKRLSLEELMELEVTTVSRVAESTRLTPAAIFVITQDDIRRSGATSVPEVLRVAPGVQVARIDATRWSIGIRGFADRLARSMLVLIDGRAVYSPLFAGTYWEVQDLVLEDIDRIEVVRGPGGTLWGANAVTGVINIITRHARDTQGTLATVTAGRDGTAIVQAQQGGRLGSGYARAYVRGSRRAAMGESDEMQMAQVGFRGDWGTASTGTFMLSGDAYTARLDQRAAIASFLPPFTETVARSAPLSGANVLARWTKPISQNTTVQLQVYYDRATRDERPVSEERDTVDVDYQQAHRRSARHTVIWGVGARGWSRRIDTVGLTTFTPMRRFQGLYTAFAQDEFAIVPTRLRMSIGAKLEYRDDTGLGVQPSVRLLWTPSDRHGLVWSITRALRTPSAVETDYSTTSLVNPAIPSFVRLQPNPDFESEEVIAHELGYRANPAPWVYATVSGFYNQLDRMLSTDLDTPFVEDTPGGSPHLILPVAFRNGLAGASYGSDVSVDLRPAPWWRWTMQYAFLRVDVHRRPGSTDVSQERRYEGGSPRHQGQMALSFDVSHRWTVDWTLRGASRLASPSVPAYATSDVRLGWLISPDLELALIGRDLHQARHVEWPGGPESGIRRSGLVRLTWRR